MKKIFKTLTIAVIAIVATLACVLAFGCTEKEGASADYTFTITLNGNAVNGQTGGASGGAIGIQICNYKTAEEKDQCLIFEHNIGSDGVLKLSQQQLKDKFGVEVTKFELTVFGVKGCKDYEKVISEKGEYTVELVAA